MPGYHSLEPCELISLIQRALPVVRENANPLHYVVLDQICNRATRGDSTVNSEEEAHVMRYCASLLMFNRALLHRYISDSVKIARETQYSLSGLLLECLLIRNPRRRNIQLGRSPAADQPPLDLLVRECNVQDFTFIYECWSPWSPPDNTERAPLYAVLLASLVDNHEDRVLAEVEAKFLSAICNRATRTYVERRLERLSKRYFEPFARAGGLLYTTVLPRVRGRLMYEHCRFCHGTRVCNPIVHELWVALPHAARSRNSLQLRQHLAVLAQLYELAPPYLYERLDDRLKSHNFPLSFSLMRVVKGSDACDRLDELIMELSCSGMGALKKASRRHLARLIIDSVHDMRRRWNRQRSTALLRVTFELCFSRTRPLSSATRADLARTVREWSPRVMPVVLVNQALWILDRLVCGPVRNERQYAPREDAMIGSIRLCLRTKYMQSPGSRELLDRLAERLVAGGWADSIAELRLPLPTQPQPY